MAARRTAAGRRAARRAAAAAAAAVLAVALAASPGSATEVTFENLPAPTGLSASHTDAGVELAWTAPDAAPDHPQISSYEVESREKDSIGWSKIAVGLDSTEHVSSVPLVGGRTYEYRVVAVFTADQVSAFGAFSDTATFTVPSVNAPGSLTASRSADGVDLSWQAPTVAEDAPILSGYEIRRTELRAAGFEDDILISEWIEVDDSEAVSYLDRDAEATSGYSYGIQAVYGYVQSGITNAASDVVAGGV